MSRPSRRVVIVSLTAFAIVGVLLITVLDGRDQDDRAALHDDLGTLDTGQLEAERLRQEIIAAELATRREAGVAGRLAAAAPFLTGLVAVAGVLITIWKQIDENARQREEDRKQRHREHREAQERAEAQEEQRRLDREERRASREQAALENQRRFDEKFAATIISLGSSKAPVAAGAAVMLHQFLKPRYDDYFDDVLALLLANVRLDHHPQVRDLLVKTVADALRSLTARAGGEEALDELDLARAKLPRIDLGGMRLHKADIAFADLTSANLRGCDLTRVRGFAAVLDKASLSAATLKEARLRTASCKQAVFHGADLVSVDLQQACLDSADFSQARLQSAHLEGADLTGAQFPEANLADTYFAGAQLDDRAVHSISRARNWRKSHFDSAQLTRIERASQT